METLYTVYWPSGAVEATDYTVTEAAAAILNYHSDEFEIRRYDPKYNVNGVPAWELWSKSPGGNWVRTSSVAPVYATTEDAAWPEIAAQVLILSHQWRGACYAEKQGDA